MSDEEQRLQHQMVSLIRAFGLHRPDHTPCGQPMSVSEAHTLLELTGGGVITQTHLAAELRLEKSTVSRLVMQLEQRRWISREPNPQDGRAVLLRLTEKGWGVAEQLASARMEKYSRLLAAIPDAERNSVLYVLDVLVEAMNKAEIGD